MAGKRRVASGFAYAAAAVLMWGAQFPIAKAAFASIDAFHATALRYLIPTLLLAALLWRAEGARALRYDGRLGAAMSFGTIGMCASPALVFGGLMLTRPEVAAIVIATQPSMTALAEWFVRGRRPAGFTLACIALAFAGVVSVVTRWSLALSPSGHELIGDLCVLAGAACWVVYTMGLEHFRGWSTLRTTTLTMVPGTVGNVLLVVVGLELGWLSPVSAEGWRAAAPHLVYLALAGVMAGMLCWNAGAQRIGALNTMLLLNLVPVVAFAIRFAQGYQFVPAELVGAAMVIVALAANNLYMRRQAAKRAAAADASSPAA